MKAKRICGRSQFHLERIFLKIELNSGIHSNAALAQRQPNEPNVARPFHDNIFDSLFIVR